MRATILIVLASVGLVAVLPHGGQAASPLRPKAITPLPLGRIVPTGWYRDLLLQQMHSLSGNLSRFWPDVRYAPWFGGNGTAQGNRMHERGPYWLNGALPLAYLLTTNATDAHRRAFGPGGPPPPPLARRRRLRGREGEDVMGVGGSVPFEHVHPPCGDGSNAGCPPANNTYPPWSSQRLVEECEHWVEFMYSNRNTSNGWLGNWRNPGVPDGNGEYWTHWNVHNAMRMYNNFHEATGIGPGPGLPTTAAIRAALIADALEARRRMTGDPKTDPTCVPLGPKVPWSSSRWPEWAFILHQMIDTFPEVRANATLEAALLDAASVTQRDGFPWMEAFFTNKSFPKCGNCATPGTGPGWDMHSHGVNGMMALKQGPVWWRQSGNQSDLDGVATRLGLYDTYHGQAHGFWSADECIGGRAPGRGVELCAIVEAMLVI